MTKERFNEISQYLIELDKWIEDIRHTSLLDNIDGTDIDNVVRFSNAMHHGLLDSINEVVSNLDFKNQIVKIINKNNLDFSMEKFHDENNKMMFRIKLFKKYDNTNPYRYNTINFVEDKCKNTIIFDYFAKSKEELKEMLEIQEELKIALKKFKYE